MLETLLNTASFLGNPQHGTRRSHRQVLDSASLGSHMQAPVQQSKRPRTGAHLSNRLAAARSHSGGEALIDGVQQRAQLLVLRLAHVAAQQLIACASSLFHYSPVFIKLHTHQSAPVQQSIQRQAGRACGLVLPYALHLGLHARLLQYPSQERPCTCKLFGALTGKACSRTRHAGTCPFSSLPAYLRRRGLSSLGCPSGAHTPPVRAATHVLGR